MSEREISNAVKGCVTGQSIRVVWRNRDGVSSTWHGALADKYQFKSSSGVTFTRCTVFWDPAQCPSFEDVMGGVPLNDHLVALQLPYPGVDYFSIEARGVAADPNPAAAAPARRAQIVAVRNDDDDDDDDDGAVPQTRALVPYAANATGRRDLTASGHVANAFTLPGGASIGDVATWYDALGGNAANSAFSAALHLEVTKGGTMPAKNDADRWQKAAQLLVPALAEFDATHAPSALTQLGNFIVTQYRVMAAVVNGKVTAREVEDLLASQTDDPVQAALTKCARKKEQQRARSSSAGRRGGRGGRGRGGKRGPFCNRCKTAGHWASQCTAPASGNAGGSSNTSKRN
jgi:hypothetical protein